MWRSELLPTVSFLAFIHVEIKVEIQDGGREESSDPGQSGHLAPSRTARPSVLVSAEIEWRLILRRAAGTKGRASSLR